MTAKTDQQQIELIKKINQEKKLNIFTLSAGDSLYTLIATYLATGNNSCLNPYIYLRTASYFRNFRKTHNYNVEIGYFDETGISIVQASLDNKDAGRVLAIE